MTSRVGHGAGASWTGRTTAYDYETFPLSNITDVLQHPRYDLSRRTLLYLHGFTETPMKESVVTVVSEFCSHAHSWRFYAASVLDERRYPAAPCASWFHFQWGLCPSAPATVAYMGFPDPGRAEGTYYLVAVPP
ncbi:Phospholipase A1 member A [Gryllus bimaculatus]|nr:Phospholipase A1 member A [Gryllus bimaculatus]